MVLGPFVGVRRSNPTSWSHVSHGQNFLYKEWRPCNKDPVTSLNNLLLKRVDHGSCGRNGDLDDLTSGTEIPATVLGRDVLHKYRHPSTNGSQEVYKRRQKSHRNRVPCFAELTDTPNQPQLTLLQQVMAGS